MRHLARNQRVPKKLGESSVSNDNERKTENKDSVKTKSCDANTERPKQLVVKQNANLEDEHI